MMLTKTILIFLGIVLINIIFGYWRSNTTKLSVPWILAIHIPVPIAILLRLAFLGWNWLLLPIFVAAFAAGQYAGGKTRDLLLKQSIPLSSFLLADLGKIAASRQKKQANKQKG